MPRMWDSVLAICSERFPDTTPERDRMAAAPTLDELRDPQWRPKFHRPLRSRLNSLYRGPDAIHPDVTEAPPVRNDDQNDGNSGDGGKPNPLRFDVRLPTRFQAAVTNFGNSLAKAARVATTPPRWGPSAARLRTAASL